MWHICVFYFGNNCNKDKKGRAGRNAQRKTKSIIGLGVGLERASVSFELCCLKIVTIEDQSLFRSFPSFGVWHCNLVEIIPYSGGKILPPCFGQKSKGTGATSVNCYHITRPHITEDGNIYSDSREGFRSQLFQHWSKSSSTFVENTWFDKLDNL
jgi:hypothetical protein